MRFAILSTLCAASLLTTGARASTWVEPAASSSPASEAGADAGAAAATIVEARTAFSASPDRTVAWEQLVVSIPAGPVDEDSGVAAAPANRVWLVAVPDGGRVEVGNGAWLDALDTQSAPRFSVPAGVACGATWTGDGVDADDASAALAIAGLVDFVGVAPATVADQIASSGFTIDASMRAQIASLAALGEHVVAIGVHASAAGTYVTPAIRVVGPATRPLPIALTPEIDVPLRLFVVAPWRAVFDSALVETPDFSTLTWDGAGAVDFATVLANVPTGLAETFASRDALFFPASSADESVAIGSIADDYFGAVKGGDATATLLCTDHVTGERLSSSVVASSCAQSVLVDDATTPAPCVPATAAEVDPSALVCGGFDDLAVALGGLGVGTSWVTRIETRTSIVATLPGSPRVVAANDAELSQFHVVTQSSATCPGPSTGSGAPTTNDAGTTGSNDTTDTAAAVVADGCASGAADSCDSSSGTSANGDSCSGDSSSSDTASGCGGNSDSSSCATRSHRKTRASPVGYLMVALVAIARRARRPRVSLNPQ